MAEAKKPAKKTAAKAPASKAKALKKVVKPEEKKVEPIQETTQAVSKGSDQEVAEPSTTKAGKHSAKALKEAAEKEAKEARKAEANTEETDKPKVKAAPKTRSQLERRGKKFREVAKLIEKDKEYSLPEGLELAAKTTTAKFDATVELHIRLNVDPRHADQNIRDSLVLPAGTGKTIRIAVFAETEDAAKAKKAGADIIGVEEITQNLDKNKIDFDVLIATPTQMAKLGKYARILGPRGLMPNPKSGTVTTDVTKAVSEAKAGRVEYRVDSTGIVHLGIGKVSFGVAKLEDNAKAVLASVRAAKPSGVKGNYIKSLFVTTSMGPSVKLNTGDTN